MMKRYNLFTSLALGLTLWIASCTDSSEPWKLTTLAHEELPRSRSPKSVYGFFGQDEARYRHLSLSASGAISQDGTLLWNPQAPDETALLDSVLVTYGAEMERIVDRNWESPFPYGALIVHAPADVHYGFIEFLLARCLNPAVGIREFQFPVRDLEDGEFGVLGLWGHLGFEAGEIHQWELKVEAIEDGGVMSYSLDGGVLRDFRRTTQALREVVEQDGGVWIRPSPEMSWGAVTMLVGEFQDPDATGKDSGQRFVRWLGGFHLYD